VYKVAAAWSMCIAWPLYVVVGCAPLAYLGLFGDAYEESGKTTVILMSLAMLLAVAVGAADTLLLMAGRSGYSMANNLVALALDVGICLWLIPRLGITGAAIAWAVASTVRSVLAVLQCRATLGVVSLGRPAVTVATANLVCLALPISSLSLFIEIRWQALLLACLVLVPLYVGALWLGRRPLMLGVLGDLVRRRSSGLRGVGSEEPRTGRAGG
jgi:O-antigen/teichoic acid export membrane protein